MIRIIEYTIQIAFTCPITQLVVRGVLSPDTNFYATEYPCEDCGTHGEIRITFDCPECDNTHEVIVQEW